MKPGNIKIANKDAKISVGRSMTIFCFAFIHYAWVAWSKRFDARFSPVMWSKLKIVTIQWMKSRIWDTMGDWYINNFAKNQYFHVLFAEVYFVHWSRPKKRKHTTKNFVEFHNHSPLLGANETIIHYQTIALWYKDPE